MLNKDSTAGNIRTRVLRTVVSFACEIPAERARNLGQTSPSGSQGCTETFETTDNTQLHVPAIEELMLMPSARRPNPRCSLYCIVFRNHFHLDVPKPDEFSLINPDHLIPVSDRQTFDNNIPSQDLPLMIGFPKQYNIDSSCKHRCYRLPDRSNQAN